MKDPGYATPIREKNFQRMGKLLRVHPPEEPFTQTRRGKHRPERALQWREEVIPMNKDNRLRFDLCNHAPPRFRPAGSRYHQNIRRRSADRRCCVPEQDRLPAGGYPVGIHAIHAEVAEFQRGIQLLGQRSDMRNYSGDPVVFSGKHAHREWAFLEIVARMNNPYFARGNAVRQKEGACIGRTVSRCPEFPAHCWNIHQVIKVRVSDQHGPRGGEMAENQFPIGMRGAEENIPKRNAGEIRIHQQPFTAAFQFHSGGAQPTKIHSVRHGLDCTPPIGCHSARPGGVGRGGRFSGRGIADCFHVCHSEVPVR